MTDISDAQIVSTILADPETLDRLPVSTLLTLWLSKCRKDPRYQPIKEMVRKVLSTRIHGSPGDRNRNKAGAQDD